LPLRLPGRRPPLRTGLGLRFTQDPGSGHSVGARLRLTPAYRPTGADYARVGFDVDADALALDHWRQQGDHPRTTVREADRQFAAAYDSGSAFRGHIDRHVVGPAPGPMRDEAAREPVTEDELQPPLAARDARQLVALGDAEPRGDSGGKRRVLDRAGVGQPSERPARMTINQRYPPSLVL
jgi:hypothetical protein